MKINHVFKEISWQDKIDSTYYNPSNQAFNYELFLEIVANANLTENEMILLANYIKNDGKIHSALNDTYGPNRKIGKHRSFFNKFKNSMKKLNITMEDLYLPIESEIDPEIYQVYLSEISNEH
jgi:hypothetical protein